MTQPKLIRKYVNRRLYDTTQSRYVNLDDLRKLIVDGATIKVVEQASGENITTNVLLQIIEDRQKTGTKILSADFLCDLIRLSERDVDAGASERLNVALAAALNRAGLASDESPRFNG